MKIAVFTNQFPSRVSTFFARDMKALLDTGIDIHIFPIYPLDSELWQFVPDLLDHDDLPIDRIHHINLTQCIDGKSLRNWISIGRVFPDIVSIFSSAILFGAMPVLKSLYVIPKALYWANKFRYDFDHVLAYWGNYAGTCAYLYHRLTDRRIPFSTFLHAGTDLYRDQVFLDRKLLYANNIFVVCNFNREFIGNLYPKIIDRISGKIHLHHTALNLSEFNYHPQDRLINRVIGVGSLAKLKGFDYLLLAAKELRDRGVRIEVELVGDGDEKRNLQTLAHRLDISDRVQFRGWLPFSQVRDAMADATILVHPSTGLGDAVPTVIKEAMALGTPVIGSNIAGIPELLDNGRCGVLVPKKDVGALANSIEFLMKSEPLRMRYAELAREYVEEHFDFRKNGKRLASILRRTSRQYG